MEMTDGPGGVYVYAYKHAKGVIDGMMLKYLSS